MNPPHESRRSAPTAVSREVIGMVSPTQIRELSTIAGIIYERYIQLRDGGQQQIDSVALARMVQTHVEECILYALASQGRAWFTPQDSLMQLFTKGEDVKLRSIDKLSVINTSVLRDLNIVDPGEEQLRQAQKIGGYIGVPMETALAVAQGLERRLNSVRSFLQKLMVESTLAPQAKALLASRELRDFNIPLKDKPILGIPDLEMFKMRVALFGNLIANILTHNEPDKHTLAIDRETLDTLISLFGQTDSHKKNADRIQYVTTQMGKLGKNKGLYQSDIADFTGYTIRQLLHAAELVVVGNKEGWTSDGGESYFGGVLYLDPEVLRIKKKREVVTSEPVETTPITLALFAKAQRLVEELTQRLNDISEVDLGSEFDAQSEELHNQYLGRIATITNPDLTFLTLHIARSGRNKTRELDSPQAQIFTDVVVRVAQTNLPMLVRVLEYTNLKSSYFTENVKPKIGTEFFNNPATIREEVYKELVANAPELPFSIAPAIVSYLPPGVARQLLEAMTEAKNGTHGMSGFGSVEPSRLAALLEECNVEITHDPFPSAIREQFVTRSSPDFIIEILDSLTEAKLKEILVYSGF